MNMPRTAIAFGVLLTLQGVGFYIATSSKSVTALIPAFVGIPMLALGLAAFRDFARKHAMHAASAIALLGFLAAVGRMASARIHFSPAGISVLLLALITGGFAALSIKSFVDTRRHATMSS
jgi:lysylphosphatidylglycerol synthetase-like protein (DUF2156 family)